MAWVEPVISQVYLGHGMALMAWVEPVISQVYLGRLLGSTCDRQGCKGVMGSKGCKGAT